MNAKENIEMLNDTLNLIMENAIIEFNAWSHRYGRMSARYSEVDAEEYIEAEARRTQARVMLEDNARAIGVEIKYADEQETTKCEGDVVPVYWARAYMAGEEV